MAIERKTGAGSMLSGVLEQSRPTAPTGPATPHDSLYLRCAVIAVDGGTVVRMSDTGTLSDADSVGRRLAAALLDAGADSLLGSTR